MAGISTRKILSSLRQDNPKPQAISKTVYNAKAKTIKESLAGRTMIEALFEELGEGGFTYNVRYGEDNRVTHLFFAHPVSIMLNRNYPFVFVMHCTYKTNKYKMPLLEVIDESSFNEALHDLEVQYEEKELVLN
ncbi:uncharacterized protein [Elaeis guineensis]|uniref:uncharacterized protein n=1 Tax=Elaeis guineensis var. tenera TaxID=51953 RepID=UPI003C6D4CC3